MGGKIYTSASELIGGTPLLELTGFEKKYGLPARILAKLEYLNPAGSVKDRVALSIIEDAEKSGRLTPGGMIIEPTSGNTGVGLAALAAARGYRLVVVMPETMSMERRKLIQAYGAKLVLTPGAEGMKGAIAKAEELARENPGSIIAGQFENPANPAAHYKNTGPEILADTGGKVDFFVAGVGTGGTLTGAGRFLKEHVPGIRIVAVEPCSSPVLSGGKAGAHKIQGIGAGFVPKILDTALIDEIICVEDADALETAAQFGPLEGFLGGISAGAAVWAAMRLASRPENSGKTIAAILPDGGERYLSTALFS